MRCGTLRNGSPTAPLLSWWRSMSLVPSATALCATKCKRCPLVPDCTGLWPARACQVVGTPLSDFLARDHDLHLAVPAWMGKLCDGSLFPHRDSHDPCDWRCLRDRTPQESSLADVCKLVGGIRCGDLVRDTPIACVSTQFNPLHRH